MQHLDIRTQAHTYAVMWFLHNHPGRPLDEVQRYGDSEWRRYVHLVGMAPKEAVRLVVPPASEGKGGK